MITLMQKTAENTRTRIVASRMGVSAVFYRKQAAVLKPNEQRWYVRDTITCVWPWKKV